METYVTYTQHFIPRYPYGIHRHEGMRRAVSFVLSAERLERVLLVLFYVFSMARAHDLPTLKADTVSLGHRGVIVISKTYS